MEPEPPVRLADYSKGWDAAIDSVLTAIGERAAQLDLQHRSGLWPPTSKDQGILQGLKLAIMEIEEQERRE